MEYIINQRRIAADRDNIYFLQTWAPSYKELISIATYSGADSRGGGGRRARPPPPEKKRKERKEKERKERKGKERKGKERKREERRAKTRVRSEPRALTYPYIGQAPAVQLDMRRALGCFQVKTSPNSCFRPIYYDRNKMPMISLH